MVMITSLNSRFRALITVLSIVISLAVFILVSLYYQPYPAGRLRLVDIAFLDTIHRLCGRWPPRPLTILEKEPLPSTILFTVLGTSIVIIARASSAIYNLLKTSFYNGSSEAP
jgi:hypothetical protein